MGLDARLLSEEDAAAALLLHKTPAPRPFGQWMRATVAEDEAALKIQSFLRDKLRLTHVSSLRRTASTTSSSSLSGAASPSEAAGAAPPTEDDDGAHRQYELLLWHGSSLGDLVFEACARTGYPRVVGADGNDSLPGMWNVREGDFLLAVNELSANASATPFDSVMRILDDGVRPAVLRFRRPCAHELPDAVGRRRRTLSLVRMEKQQSRARLEKALCHVIWREEDGPLGIQLKPDAGHPYPVVSEVHATGLIGRGASRHRLRVGDMLLTINHYDVQQLGYKRTVQVMQFAPKPLVLTFRRSAPVDVAPRTFDL